MNREVIYCIEDDEGIREVYQGAFEGLYDVEMFEDGASFFARYGEQKPSLVIVDLMLPDTDGYSILTEIRKTDERLPIIIVSARSDEMSYVKGFNRGADDYVSKPFSVMELLARVKSSLRRANLYVTKCNGFTVDNNTYSVQFNGEDLHLTLKEFKLMKLLIGRAGETISREEFFREVWGEEYMGETRTLDIHITQIRDKIKRASGGDVITTVRGVGYRLD